MSISIDPKNIKALALDLDGTILAPGVKLNDRTIRAVKACRRQGLKVIINTGRTIDGAEPFRAALGLEGPMVYCNGAIVMDMPEGRLLSATLLDLEVARFCVDLSRETGAYYQVFFPGGNDKTRTVLVAEQEGAQREMYFHHAGRRATLGDLKEALSQPGLAGCIKGMFLAEPDVLDALRPKIDRQFGKSIYIAQTLRTFLEIMDARASKGQGLKLVMDHYSLKREEVIAFGDEENDLPMFAAAGFCAAPFNAKDNVKAAADIVVGSNAEDGIAAFLEEFFGL
ncbi:MAG: Cof-type HAD-IIB family hydrolase [Treponema sp.]|nr:Cof-type HAD-IIB family hydrolase [Treponema sp.]